MSLNSTTFVQVFQFLSYCSSMLESKWIEGSQFLVQCIQSHCFCHQCEECHFPPGGFCHYDCCCWKIQGGSTRLAVPYPAGPWCCFLCWFNAMQRPIWLTVTWLYHVYTIWFLKIRIWANLQFILWNGVISLHFCCGRGFFFFIYWGSGVESLPAGIVLKITKWLLCN